jgi:hypothetical protein
VNGVFSTTRGGVHEYSRVRTRWRAAVSSWACAARLRSPQRTSPEPRSVMAPRGVQRASCPAGGLGARRWLGAAPSAEFHARDLRHRRRPDCLLGIQLAAWAGVWAPALRSLSMLTWSLSMLVSTLRATASRSAMSGEASE